jgi:hypothetical protein
VHSAYGNELNLERPRVSESLIINTQIAAELFGDEMVLIDIQSGRYFSLRGAAMDIWQLLNVPRSPAGLHAAFVAPNHAELDAALAKMQDEGLILTVAGQAASEGYEARQEYRPPLVEIYTDLAELIALDPVHEVDAEQGWPVQPLGQADV